MTCQVCKHYEEGQCTWWLMGVPPEREAPSCYLPRGIQDYPLIPQGRAYPANEGQCRYCGIKLTGQRTAYCSDEHADVYSSRFDWGVVRIRILKRDQFRCVACGVHLAQWWEADIDHIVAKMNGGTYWDYANLQTLCKRCHKQKTKQDHYLASRKQAIEQTQELTIFIQNGGGGR